MRTARVGVPKMESPLDSAVVEQIQQLGGDKLLSELVEIFLSQAPNRLQELRAGIAENDLERVAKAAHSFRSSSVSLGARAISEAAGVLERLADEGTGDEVGRRLPAFEASLSELLSFLRGEFDGGR